VLAIGTGAQAAYSAVFLGVAVLAPALREHYSLSLAATGVLIAGPGLGSMLTLLPWGLLVDHVGERIVTVVGLGLAAAALGGAAFVPDTPRLIALLVVAGAAGASVNSATGRAVMTWFEAGERGLALGVRQTAIPIGGALAALALPPIVHVGGVRAAFVALGAGCLFAALVALVGLRRAPHADATALVPRAVNPLRERPIWALAVGSGLLTCVQASIIGFTVLYLHSAKGFSTGQAGAVLAAIQGLGAAGRIGIGRWSDRLGERMHLLRSVALALAAAATLTALAAGSPAAVVVPVLVVAGGLSMSWNALSFTATAELAGHGRSGAALGFQQSVLAVSSSATAPAFAAIASGASWQAAFAAVAVCPFAGYAVLRSVDAQPTTLESTA